MRGADSGKDILQEREDVLHPMPQLQTRELKLAGYVPHMLAGGREQIHAALRELHDLEGYVAGERGTR